MDSKKTIKIILALAGLLTIVLAFVGYKMYTKQHRSVEDEKAIVVSASRLFEDFEKNELDANTKYLDKVIEVTGKISEVSVNLDMKPVIMLETYNMMFGIRCTMEDSLLTIQPGTTATIKGICTGYLSDVVITNGILKR
jgi:hypothetical protein